MIREKWKTRYDTGFAYEVLPYRAAEEWLLHKDTRFIFTTSAISTHDKHPKIG